MLGVFGAGESEAPLWLLDRIGVRDIDHLVYQMTDEGCGPRTALAINVSSSHLSAPTCNGVHGQDVTTGQEMIVAQVPKNR